MRPLRGDPARLLGPLVVSSALLSACAARPPCQVGPSAGPRAPTSAPPGVSVLTDAALPAVFADRQVNQSEIKISALAWYQLACSPGRAA